MSTITLPFKPKDKLEGSPVRQSSQDIASGYCRRRLQKAVRIIPIFWNILKFCSLAKISIPEYYPELDRSLAAKTGVKPDLSGRPQRGFRPYFIG